MEYWVNKVAVISNCGCDIGIDLIKKLKEQGMKVVALCDNNEVLKTVTEELKKDEDSVINNVVVCKLDARNVEDVKSVFHIIKQNGNVNVLFNIISRDADYTAIGGKTEDLKTIIDDNISNIVALTRTTACSMIEQQSRGHIFTISDCRYIGLLNKNLLKVTTAAVSSINEILRHEFRHLNANIKTTHIEIKCSKDSDITLRNKTKDVKDITHLIVNILQTPENLQIHELRLDIVNE